MQMIEPSRKMESVKTCFEVYYIFAVPFVSIYIKRVSMILLKNVVAYTNNENHGRFSVKTKRAKTLNRANLNGKKCVTMLQG